MAQQVKLENGEIHEFPDDATQDEINSSLGHHDMQRQNSMMSSILPKLQTPLGFHAASGAISSFLPKEYKEAARHIPQILTGEKPSFPQRAAEAVGEYLPYMAAGGPYSAGLKTRLGHILGTGAIAGEQQYGKPVEGAVANLLGAGLGYTAGKGLGYLGSLFTGKKAPIVTDVQNAILKFLQKQQGKGGALLPEESKALAEQKYITPEGKMMGVDIGTISGEPTMQAALKATQYMPFSGTATRMNTVNKQLMDKEISDLEKVVKLEESKLNENKKLHSEQQKEILKTKEPNYQAIGDIDKSIEDREQIANFLRQRQNELTSNIDQTTSRISAAPQLVNQMPNQLLQREGQEFNRANLSRANAQEVKNSFQRTMNQSHENYRPLNESKVAIDVLPHNEFKNYIAAGNDIRTNLENFKNLFGESSPQYRAVERELKLLDEFKERKNLYSVRVPELVERMKQLGEAAGKAKSLGKYNEARLLGSLDNALETDFNAILENNGYGDLADQLFEANKFHRENIIPYYSDKTLRGIIKNNKIPIGSKLAEVIHHPEYLQVLSHLPQEAKMSILMDLVSKGKGTAEGLVNLTPEQLSRNFQSLNRNIKTAIRDYAPNEYRYFENLGEELSSRKLLQQHLSDIERQQAPIERQIASLETRRLRLENANRNIEEKSEKLKEPPINELEKALANAEAAKKKKLEYQGVPSAGTLLPGALLGGGALIGGLKTLPLGLLAMGAGKGLSNLLHNPELIQAYLSGKLLPQQQDLLTQALLRAVPAAAVPSRGAKR